MEATVVSFNNNKGWGFLTTLDGEEAFFIRDECAEGRAFQAKPGDLVTYELVETRPDGKKRAKGVRSLSAAAVPVEPELLAGGDGGLQTGVVASFNSTKGWGFITVADGEDAFFIRDECTLGRAFQAKPGDPVAYDGLEVREGGKKRARGVRLLAPNGAVAPDAANGLLTGGLGGNQATIVSFNNVKGWGFITTPGGDDAFFIRDECVEGRAFQAQKGDVVFYDAVELRADGKKRARGVRSLTSVVGGLVGFAAGFPSGLDGGLASGVAATAGLGGLAGGCVGLGVPAAVNGSLTGTVASFNSQKGWGFVTLPSGEDAFFIRDECPEGRTFQVQPGEVVAFDALELREDGKRRARGVRRFLVASPVAFASGCGGYGGCVGCGGCGGGCGGACLGRCMGGCLGGCMGGCLGGCVGGWCGLLGGCSSSCAGSGCMPFAGELASGMATGTVASFNNEKGWGFITTATGEDAFFVRDECAEGRAFQASRGDAVLYESVEMRADGKKRARGVRLLGLAAPAQRSPQALQPMWSNVLLQPVGAAGLSILPAGPPGAGAATAAAASKRRRLAGAGL